MVNRGLRLVNVVRCVTKVFAPNVCREILLRANGLQAVDHQAFAKTSRSENVSKQVKDRRIERVEA
jgi:hypothetical protein